MADKGEYRGIYVALLDSWEFQELSACARACLLALKIKLGKAGIDVFYPETLTRYTGFEAAECAAALEELVEARWLVVERNIYWLRNGLRFEPSEPLSNANGRKGIRNHLATMPALAIIEEFTRYYGLNGEAPAEHVPPVPVTPFEAPSKPLPNPLRTTETETETESDSARGAPPTLVLRRSSKRAPPDFEPDDAHRRLAAELRVDVGLELAKFLDHTFANPRSDWPATFRNWLRTARPPNGAAVNGSTTNDFHPPRRIVHD